jgi:hypothetical protein
MFLLHFRTRLSFARFGGRKARATPMLFGAAPDSSGGEEAA